MVYLSHLVGFVHKTKKPLAMVGDLQLWRFLAFPTIASLSIVHCGVREVDYLLVPYRANTTSGIHFAMPTDRVDPGSTLGS
jgi:hypothetical protein